MATYWLYKRPNGLGQEVIFCKYQGPDGIRIKPNRRDQLAGITIVQVRKAVFDRVLHNPTDANGEWIPRCRYYYDASRVPVGDRTKPDDELVTTRDFTYEITPPDPREGRG